MSWTWILVTMGVLLAVGRLGAVWSSGPRARRAWERATSLSTEGNWPAAEAELRKAVRLVPGVATLRRALSGVLTQQEKYGEAEEHLRMASQLEPRNAHVQLDLGVFLAVCPPQRPEEAIDALECAVALEPRIADMLSRSNDLAFLREYDRFRNVIQPESPGQSN